MDKNPVPSNPAEVKKTGRIYVPSLKENKITKHRINLRNNIQKNSEKNIDVMDLYQSYSISLKLLPLVRLIYNRQYSFFDKLVIRYRIIAGLVCRLVSRAVLAKQNQIWKIKNTLLYNLGQKLFCKDYRKHQPFSKKFHNSYHKESCYQYFLW